MAQQFQLPDNHPIFAACERGDVAAVRKFLESGVSVYAKPEVGAEIKTYAREGGHYEIFELLFEFGYDANHIEGAFDETELFSAVRISDPRWTRLLLRHGGNVNHANKYGVTPYLIVAAVGDKERVELIKQAGADTNHKDNWGINDFMMAVRAGNFWYAEELLKADRNVNRKDISGNTSLVSAAKSGQYDVAKWLLDHGADINAEDNRGKTALDWAKANKHVKVVELLQQRMGS